MDELHLAAYKGVRHSPMASPKCGISLGLLSHFGSQASLAGRWPAGRQLRSQGRPPFDCAYHWRFIHAVGVSHGSEALFGAHAINHPLLPGA